ncbi:MAG: CoA transferase [Erythrobacter sp.]
MRIVDMTTVLMGPYCTQTLADMGAEVIKIEPSFGDIIRLVSKPSVTPKMSPTHLTLNRGKRCVDWDPKTELGKEATRRLIAKSDIFIHNVRDSGIRRLGLTFEEVKAIKPDIVYVHCRGFASTGPDPEKPAYDDIIQGISGMTSLQSRVDGTDQMRFLPSALADKVSGLHAVYGALGALHHRDRTGTAVKVEVPMLQCTTHFLLTEHFDEETMNPPTGNFGYERQLDPTRQPIQTSDGWMVVAPYSDDRWVEAFSILGAAKELEDPRISDIESRRSNRSLLQLRLAEHARRFTTDELLKLFNDNDVPAGRANRLEDLRNDPNLAGSQFFQPREHPTEGAYWEMQPPVKFVDVPEEEVSPAREIGQDTDAVLRELGLAQQDNGRAS